MEPLIESKWSKCKEDFSRILTNQGINALNFAQEMKNIENILINKKKRTVHESYKFFTRNQRKNETIENFYNELVRLAINSEFGDKDITERLVRDRIVSGVCDIKLKIILMKTCDLDLKLTLQICKSFEKKNQ